MTHFNLNAPNFFGNNGKYSWMPTPEEVNFISEAFNIIAVNKTKKSYGKINYTHQESKASPRLPINDEEEGRTVETPPLEKPVETTFHEEPRDQSEYNRPNNDTEAEDKMVPTASDRTAIEMALKKHRERNEPSSEFDEQRIIEKILNQKKQDIQNQGY
jgi:hypothetical protein